MTVSGMTCQIKTMQLFLSLSWHTPVISWTSWAVIVAFIRNRATLCKNVTAFRISPSVHFTNSVIACNRKKNETFVCGREIDLITTGSHWTCSLSQINCNRCSMILLLNGLKRNFAQRLVIGSIILQENDQMTNKKGRWFTGWYNYKLNRILLF